MHVSTWPSLNPLLLVQQQSSCRTPFPFYAPHKVHGYLARSLIYHLFRAMKIQPGETVLVPDYHHGNEVQAIKAAGAKLKFYRVDKELRIDPEEVERLCTPEVRAIFVIHYIGWPTRLEELAAIAKKKNIPLVEDCALSMLTEDQGRPIGTTGDYAIFCLYKTLPVPNGGLLVQNRNILPELEALEKTFTVPDNTSLIGRSLELGLETLMTHAEPLGRGLMTAKRAIGSLLNVAKVKRANVGDVGFDHARANLGISPLCLRLMERIDYEGIPEKRRILFNYLADKLRGGADYLFEEAGPGTCPLFFPLLVGDKKKISDELNRRGIGAVQFWNTGHPEVDQTTATDALHLRERLIELPIHQDVSFEQADYIAEQVLELCGKKRAPRLTLVPKEAPIEVDIVRGTLEAIDGLGAEWGQLAAENPNNQPFCRPEWISSYLRAFEPNAELLMITARRGGKLRGVLPLIEEWSAFVGFPAKKLRFPANIHSNRADLILGAGDKEASARAIWERVKTLSQWHVIEIRDVPEEGATHDLLRLAEADGFPIGRWESMNSPYISLAAGPDATSKFRSNLRRRLRNLEARGPVSFERVDRADPALLTAFYELERSGWKGKEGSAIAQAEATKQYYDDLAEYSSKLGLLSIYVLRHGSKIIAMQYGFTAAGRYHISKPAYDEAHKEFSPGQLLMEKVIADCTERGLTELDFLGMPMSWKLDWTKQIRRHEFCYIFRNSSYGAALRAAKFELIPLAKIALEEAHLRRAA